MAKKILRVYSITDPEMYEVSKTKRGFFLEDKPDFITFDADFADPYEADWLTEITSAEVIPQDEVLDDQLTQLTAAVEVEMKNCRDKFQDTKYFIEKAIPDNTPVWNEFGYNNYDSVRRVQTKLLLFMKNFHAVADKYKVRLIGAGYLQARIDEIETLRAALDAENLAQELFTGNLPVITQQRHIQNNVVWEIMVRVCSAGKRIFKNDYGKYQRYLLPPGEETPEALSILGLITDSVSTLPLEGVLIELAPLGIEDTTPANGRYSFGGLPDGAYALTISLADYVSQNRAVTITNGQAVEVNVALVHV